MPYYIEDPKSDHDCDNHPCVRTGGFVGKVILMERNHSKARLQITAADKGTLNDIISVYIYISIYMYILNYQKSRGFGI